MIEQIQRLNRAFFYLGKGTLCQRLKELHHENKRRRRLKRWTSYMEKQAFIETRVQGHIRMHLYLDSILSREIFCGDFELQERQFLNAFLKPGDVFVDVGANIGLFTLIAAHLVGNSGHVYAFEPYLKTYNRLVENVNLNRLKNVSCYPLALSDHTGILDMTISLDGFDAWNSLVKPTAGEKFSVEAVQTTSWDEFAKEHHLSGQVTMMKIDVEGWECHVLTGASGTLSQIGAPVIQIEFTEKAIQSSGYSCADLYSQIEKLGYKLFRYDSISNTIIADPLRKSYPYINLIAVKDPNHIKTSLNMRRKYALSFYK